jgi:hypothetical protein
MAKKKKTAKKKKKVSKKTKKKKVAKKAKKRSSKTTPKDATTALAKLVGIEVCHLCDKQPMRSLDDFENHLYEKHGGITLTEYRKYYPKSRKAFHIDKDVLSADEAYRALTHMTKYGEWPEWFDATRKIDIGAADTALLRAFSSQIIETHQDRILGIVRYVTVALRRQFEVGHAALGSKDAVEAQTRWGISLINQAIEVMHRTVDLLKKTDNLTQKPLSGMAGVAGAGGRTTFVAAAQIENADQGEQSPNRLQHQMTAVASELHGMVQSFITTGPEHGEKPPSQVIDVEVEVEEQKKSGDNGDPDDV